MNQEADTSNSPNGDQELARRSQLLLKESIFLRYLPVSLVKFLNERGNKAFLEVYRTKDEYRSSILIWTLDLRLHLEGTIKGHAT